MGQALEWLTDLELESRNGQAIERRFRLSNSPCLNRPVFRSAHKVD
jgi:hypothetical protein